MPMGLCYSCTRSTQPNSNSIRVVHLDGFLEDFEGPTMVHQVISTRPKHFMSTPIQLIQNASVPLKPDAQLEPGKVYFVLPFSILQFHDSPRDLISLTKKLTTIAKTHRSRSRSRSRSKSKSKPNLNLKANPTPRAVPLASPQNTGSIPISQDGSNGGNNNMRNSTRFSWKPLLSTIREISFNRRSESDLQD